MKSFLWDVRGYALVLTLLFMPVFVGMSLIIIDLGRANNANSDLYAAADAVALAAAGELDGGTDAIDRALDAAAQVTNTVSFLGLGEGEYRVTLDYDGSEIPFFILFLTEIPEDDAIPIDEAWMIEYGIFGTSAEEQRSARYAYVRAKSIDLNPIFLLVTASDREVPVQAHAVAKRNLAVCGIAPMYMCNPFEKANGDGRDFEKEFWAGKMNARLVILHGKQVNQGNPGPGNYGFLDQGRGNKDLAAAFANPSPDSCFGEKVSTKTGSSNVSQALNTRFDIYKKGGGEYGVNNSSKYPPAKNVRKSYWTAIQGGETCGGSFYDWTADPAPSPLVGSQPDPLPYMGLPENADIASNGANQPYIGEGYWDIDTYLKVNHEGLNVMGQTLPDGSINPAYDAEKHNQGVLDDLDAIKDAQFQNGIASPGVDMPSRYAVYLWELAEQDRLDTASPGVTIPEDVWAPNIITVAVDPPDPNSVWVEPTSDYPAGYWLGDWVLADTVIPGETGNPSCSKVAPLEDPLRRTVQAAIINCLEAKQGNEKAFTGSSEIVKVEAYATFFLTAPMDGANDTIEGELIDATGGDVDTFLTLENKVRAEAILVR